MQTRSEISLYPVLNGKASLVKALRGLASTVFAGALLSACATTTPQGPYPTGPQQPPIGSTPKPQPKTPDTKKPDTKKPEVKKPKTSTSGLTPPFMDTDDIRRVAIVLPFSAKSSRLRAEANSMLHAAELALFSSEDDNVLLIAVDSAGTAAGAKIATRSAIKQGADVILGPILAASVKASGQVARKNGTPVIAFSTDTSVAGNGVYLLSFPPEAEVRRITQFVAESGAQKFAFLGPDSTYGKRVLGAYREQVRKIDGVMTGVEIYSGKDITVMQEPARRLAKLYTDAQLANEAAGNPISEAAYHVVLLPEGGTALRSLAPLLSYFEDDINAANVQFIGTGLWNRKEVVREPALSGGIFAGPDTEGKKLFNARYESTFAQEPSRLATLAYDGVHIAAFVAGKKKSKMGAALTDAAGFYGVDGLVRFNRDGTPQRGLAVYQVKNGRFVIIDPAPRTSDGAF